MLILLRTKFQEKVYIIFSILIIGINVIIFLNGISQVEDFIWPLYFLLASMPNRLKSLSIILVILTGSFILFLSYPFPITTVIALIGLYFGMKSRQVRLEANQLRVQHLHELNKAYSDLKKAHDELQEANIYSIRYAALAERMRIARDIHDGLGHQMTSLIIQLQVLEVMLNTKQGEACEKIQEILSIAHDGMEEVRRAVREWANDNEMLGLVALRGLISQTEAHSQLDFEFVEIGSVSEWSIETSAVLYRVLQEALTNVLRHSNASLVKIVLAEEEDKVMLKISDNGAYNDERPFKLGFGTNGMIERCKLLGGQCTFTGNTPHGLTVKAIVPIEPSALK
jgi:signal transduction histidine kinase